MESGHIQTVILNALFTLELLTFNEFYSTPIKTDTLPPTTFSTLPLYRESKFNLSHVESNAEREALVNYFSMR